jgi:hypothetical protein
MLLFCGIGKFLEYLQFLKMLRMILIEESMTKRLVPEPCANCMLALMMRVYL